MSSACCGYLESAAIRPYSRDMPGIFGDVIWSCIVVISMAALVVSLMDWVTGLMTNHINVPGLVFVTVIIIVKGWGWHGCILFPESLRV